MLRGTKKTKENSDTNNNTSPTTMNLVEMAKLFSSHRISWIWFLILDKQKSGAARFHSYRINLFRWHEYRTRNYAKIEGFLGLISPAALEFNPSRGIVKWASTDLINVTGFRYWCANVRGGRTCVVRIIIFLFIYSFCAINVVGFIYWYPRQCSPAHKWRTTKTPTHKKNKQFRGGIDSDWLNNFNIHEIDQYQLYVRRWVPFGVSFIF